MPAKKLSETDKVQAVLDLIQAKGTMAEICNRYGISPTYLYKLRDRALEAVKVALAGADKRIFPGSASWSWSSAEPNSYSATKPWSLRF